MTSALQLKRKSPTESATLFKIDTKQIGNDGEMWIVKVFFQKDNLVKRWVRLASHQKEFDTLLKKKKLTTQHDVKLYWSLIKKMSPEIFWKYTKTIKHTVFNTPRLGMHSLKITGKIILTDPSYRKSNRKVRLINNCENGVWDVYFHSWLDYPIPNVLIAYSRAKRELTGITWEKVPPITIKTDTIVVFPEEEYPVFTKEKHKKWYEEHFVNDYHFVTAPNGYAVKSGYGSGVYNVELGIQNNKVFGIVVFFTIPS